MSKKQTKGRSKKLQKLQVLRQKRELLEKRKKVSDKSKRLNIKIQKENQRIKQLKRETGASKYFNLTNLVKTAKGTANKLKDIDKDIQKYKKKHKW